MYINTESIQGSKFTKNSFERYGYSVIIQSSILVTVVLDL